MITAIFGGDERRAELVFSQWKTGGPTLFYKVLGGNSEAEFTSVGSNLGVWIHGYDHGVWYFARLGRRPARGALARGGIPRGERARLAGRRRRLQARGRREEAARARAGAVAGAVVKLIALFAVALLTTAAAPAKPKLRGTMDVAVARDGSL